MTIEKGSQVIGAFVQLRSVEQTRRGNRHGSSSQYWALMRDHFRRCTRKGIVDPKKKEMERRSTTTAAQIVRKTWRLQTRNDPKRTHEGRTGELGYSNERTLPYEWCITVARATRMDCCSCLSNERSLRSLLRWLSPSIKTTRMTHDGRTAQSWDIQLREGLGDNAKYHQPRQLREQIHLGGLKIKQTWRTHSSSKATPWVSVDREDCQKTWTTESSRVTPQAGRAERHTHQLRRRLNGMAGGRVRGGTNQGNGKNTSTFASSQKLECLWWSTKGAHQSGRWKYPHRTHRTSLPAHAFSSLHSHQYLLVKTLACAFAAQTFLALCDWYCDRECPTSWWWTGCARAQNRRTGEETCTGWMTICL